MTHAITELLIQTGLSTRESLKPYHGRVRDRDDIGVLRCDLSGVIVLDGIGHIGQGFYERNDDLSYWNAASRDAALRQCRADDERRAGMIRNAVSGKRWLDVGTGLGGILDLLRDDAGSVAAVEPQAGIRRILGDAGYAIFPALDAVADASLDVVTLFHVYEHVTDPVGFLRTAARKLVPGGVVCIEVPHARDALLTQFDSLPFRDFTLWSEHLLLHTRDSLGRFIAAAGLSVVSIQGIQRYPLANHLHWLAKGRPGGHAAWHHLVDQPLDREYERLLASLDLTDTLVAWARLPA